MPQRPTRCKRCGASGNDVPISRRGLCADCSTTAVLQNMHALQAENGPQYERWLAGNAAAVARRAAAYRRLTAPD